MAWPGLSDAQLSPREWRAAVRLRAVQFELVSAVVRHGRRSDPGQRHRRQGPFHGGSNTEYARAMGDLENFVGMLAASVGLIDALATQASSRTSCPVLASGLSLDGWVVNLHRACFDTVDRYVPIFAGAALGEMFVSSIYRKLTAEPARRRPDYLREILDFEAEFSAVGTDDCSPLLARYDRIIEYDRQRPAYAGLSLSVLENGHVTGSLASDRLRDHVRSTCSTDRIGRE
jgi:hypothetical protein